MQLYRVWWKPKKKKTKKRGCQQYKLLGRGQHYKYIHPKCLNVHKYVVGDAILIFSLWFKWICLNRLPGILIVRFDNESKRMTKPSEKYYVAARLQRDWNS